MDSEEIERSFANVGWGIDGGFADYLVIDHDRDGISILAPEAACETDEGPTIAVRPAFGRRRWRRARLGSCPFHASKYCWATAMVSIGSPSSRLPVAGYERL
jgi:hypothetical protein